jgi:hypothetical protein
MNKAFVLFMISAILVSSSRYYGSTTAPVALAGGIMKAQNVEGKKYRRKDCPVCKGKGWYMSGDKISKVECGYCEPDKASPAAVISPIIKSQPNCTTGRCPNTRKY